MLHTVVNAFAREEGTHDPGGLHVQELLWQQKGLPGLQVGWEWGEMWLVLNSAETLPKVYFLVSKNTFLHQKGAFLVHFW